MKKQLIAQTPLGLIEGKEFECGKKEEKETISFLQQVAEDGAYMNIKNEEGNYILARGVIENSVFLLKNIEE